MFQQIIGYFNNIAFFNSLTFGIIAMVLVGASWCLTGLIMGAAPKKGLEPSIIQLGGGLWSVLLSIVLLIATGDYSTASPKATFLTCLAYFTGTAMNFFMLLIMSKAMQLGPNGIIWSIIQSALIFPFLGGVVFFGVELTLLRGIGIVLLLLALALFALTKNNDAGNTGKSGSIVWKLLAFAGMLIAGTQQNITTMPSYFEAAREVSSIVRTLSAAAGGLTMAIIWTLCKMSPEYRTLLKQNIKNPTLWKYIVALQLSGLLFAYMLFYPGMNIMAARGLGGMCYPLMVGSCIVSFTLVSAILLKEKLKILQIAALVICVTGLCLICTGASR